MNIFWLDSNFTACVEQHCDKHVVKQVLEYAQLLSSAHHLNNSPYKSDVYKLAHKAHPCTLWTAKSAHSYSDLYSLFCLLAEEYTYRYGKVHKSYRELREVLAYNPSPDIGPVSAPLCMPNDCKSDDVVQSYRTYFLNYKQHIATWTKRPVPKWFYPIN